MLNAQVMPGKEHHRKGHFPASLHLWNLHREEKETVGAESKRERKKIRDDGRGPNWDPGDRSFAASRSPIK
jgi:hypothetical protein